MKVAINKKYKYLTFISDCPEGLVFDEWVMQDKFETHSVIDIDDDIDIEHLRYDQFDYDADTDSFAFNPEKYNALLVELSKPPKPTEQERLEALEMAMLEMVMGGM